MIPIYSRDGSEDFNRRLHATLIEIGDEVERALGQNLVALILGGGYGRGEGGIVLSNGTEMPYNDLDFTLVVVRKNGIAQEALEDVGRRFAEKLEIHVDFSRPLTIGDIEHWPHWLMWYDLINGHVVLKGPPDILEKHAPPDLLKPLAIIEGTRLLLNRGAGLLWAFRIVRGLEQSPDQDFIRRNYYKCALALGDALLIAHERFTTRYLGRDVLLADLERDLPTVAAFNLQSIYKEALRFKFRPDLVPFEDILERNLQQLAVAWGSVFLHLENLRTGRSWSSLDDYVTWDGIREKDQHSFRMIVRNLTRNLQMGRVSWKYPRETLYRQLPILLNLTGTGATNWPEQTEEFLRIWNRFN